MKCEIPLSDGSESYEKGDTVLVLPELEKEDTYAVATDYCKVLYIDKAFLI